MRCMTHAEYRPPGFRRVVDPLRGGRQAAGGGRRLLVTAWRSWQPFAMKISLSQDGLDRISTDLLVVRVPVGKLKKFPAVVALDKAMGGGLLAAIAAEGFEAAAKSKFNLPAPAGLKAKRLALIALGEPQLSATAAREFAVLVGRMAAEAGSVALVPGTSTGDHVEATAEGLVTGAYRYTRYLTGTRAPKKRLARAAIVVDGRVGKGLRAAVAAGMDIASATNLARDLVNCPPNDLSATELAKECQKAARESGIQCKVFDKKGIEKLGMPLLLAVNRGSTEEPRFIHMSYKPAKAAKSAKKVVFVGKGLTFDSGGLCIKPGGSMLDMKMDMAGAAVTLATVVAAAKLKLPVEVHAVIASTDNMTGGDAYRPGDVFPSRQGMTVEIINTDAEGRLVLADALAYAAELKPDFIVDHATLTGASMVALGPYRAALFANDDGLRESYTAAAADSGEPYWPMPLDDELRDQLKSPIADIKHTGARLGGTITAALFLREFVGKTKWAHLDIAGPSFLDGAHGIYPKGATGFGVLTALRFLRSL